MGYLANKDHIANKGTGNSGTTQPKCQTPNPIWTYDKEFESLKLKVETANENIVQLERKVSMLSNPVTTKSSENQDQDELEKENH